MIYLILITLAWIAYQDIKDRQVYLFLLISLIASGLLSFLNNSTIANFINNIITNLSILLVIVLILWFYSKFRMKLELSKALGLGDVLFFIYLAVGFPTITFLVLYSFSLLFSLLLFLILKSKMEEKTVPLAGFQSIFIFVILLVNLATNMLNLYVI